MATKEQITNRMNQIKEVVRLQTIARNSLYRRLLHTNLILEQMAPDFEAFLKCNNISPDKFKAIVQDYNEILQELTNTELKSDIYTVEDMGNG